MAAGIFYLLNGVVLVGMLTSFTFWIRRLILRAIGRSEPLVPLTDSGSEPRWSVLDFLVMFGLMIVCFIALSTLFVQQGWIERTVAVAGETSMSTEPSDSPAGTNPTTVPSPASMIGVLVANSTASMIAMAVTLVWIVICNRIPYSKLGMSPSWADIRLGLLGTWWFLPPVLILSLIVSFAVPYEHPVLESLAEMTTPLLIAVMFLGTAVVAPVTEEFMFRVLLQGGLQRIADRPHAAVETQGVTAVAADAPTESDNPYQPPPDVAPSEMPSVATGRTWTPLSVWPIIVTSAVFAFMHMGQGAAPIPLFLLSIALGYLYRQTGRITAPLVVHVALNSLTLVVEFSRMAAGIPSTTGI